MGYWGIVPVGCRVVLHPWSTGLYLVGAGIRHQIVRHGYQPGWQAGERFLDLLYDLHVGI